jgi:hypothetical protein
MTGKCPKCEASLKRVKAQYIDVETPKANYKGVSYVCPFCRTILSVSVDPLAVKNGIVLAILKALDKG